MIDVTVAIPTYDMSNIIWLQLESLCLQKTKYPWEIIICEEPSPKFTGINYVLSYEKRLKEAGCQNISHIFLEDKTPLSMKWKIIAEQARGSSFLLAAADDYSSPGRIETSHTKMLEGYDWFDVKAGLFLNINTFETATYNGPVRSTALEMCTKTKYIRDLVGPPWPERGIDNWIFNQIKPRNPFRSSMIHSSLHTDGANKISSNRRGYYSNGKYWRPFMKPILKVSDILPKKIHDRLKLQFGGVSYLADT